jgi:hypothetical protein
MRTLGSGCTDPCFPDSPLDGDKRSASRSDRLTLGTQWIGCWVGPRAGLDIVARTESLLLQGLELRSLGCPPCSQSLYRLSYTDQNKWSWFYLLSCFTYSSGFLFSVYRPLYGTGTDHGNGRGIWVRFLAEARNFSLLIIQTGCVAHCLLSIGCWGGDHSPSCTAKVKNTWICTSTPPYIFMT